MSIFKRLSLSSAAAATEPVVAEAGRPVGDSKDFRRIRALPRRGRPDPATLSRWADELKEKFGIFKDTCECETKFKRPCCASLQPVQAWLLHEAAEVGGILGPIGVGQGKTLCGLMIPMVMQCKTAMLLLPPNLKRQLLDVDWKYYGQHWKLPNLAGGQWLTPGRPTLHVMAFSELSSPKSTDLLGNKLKPDIYIVDEAHCLKNFSAVRTSRFFKDIKARPNTPIFAWSGTLTSNSIKDWAHLSAAALKENSPAPHHYQTLEEWAGHLDPAEFNSPPGKLSEFGTPARKGYGLWVTNTPGVISSGDSVSCSSSIIISERPLKAPEKIHDMLKSVEKLWERPDGEELIEIKDVARCLRQLSLGFFYRWRWPRKEPTEVIERWLAVRKEWHKELRERLKHPKEHMDSPMLCAKAAARWRLGYEFEGVTYPPKTKNGPLPVWDSAYWGHWENVKNTAIPETEAVWLSEYAIEDSVKWLQESPGLLWYESKGFASRLLQRCKEAGVKVSFAGPGDEGDELITKLSGSESVIISTRSHKDGKNLQMFCRNLVSSPPSSGKDFEQLIGRTSRPGQKSDTISIEVYRHTEPFKKSIDKARVRGDYIQDTFTTALKLSSAATWTFL